MEKRKEEREKRKEERGKKKEERGKRKRGNRQVGGGAGWCV